MLLLALIWPIRCQKRGATNCN